MAGGLAIEPQSNQRGIETGGRVEDVGAAGVGLNRTSVGLKREVDALAVGVAVDASIEPAWD